MRNQPQRKWFAFMNQLWSMPTREIQFGMMPVRVQTKPSLSLESYTGNYTDEMYGDVKVTFENGKLKAKFGTYFNGTLEHWHYDTFKVTWEDEMQGQGFIGFKLNSQGKVDAMNVEGLSEFKRTK